MELSPEMLAIMIAGRNQLAAALREADARSEAAQHSAQLALLRERLQEINEILAPYETVPPKRGAALH